DIITVFVRDGKIVAKLNSGEAQFTKPMVSQIWVNGFRGDDRITNKTALAATLIGSSGNDTFVSGDGPDLIEAGDGEDTADYSRKTSDEYLSVGDGSGAALFFDQQKDYDELHDCEVIVGTEFDDVFEYAAAITLHGGGGNDTF